MFSTLEFQGTTLTTARKEKLTNPPRRFSKCYEGPSNPRAYRGKALRQAGSKENMQTKRLQDEKRSKKRVSGVSFRTLLIVSGMGHRWVSVVIWGDTWTAGGQIQPQRGWTRLGPHKQTCGVFKIRRFKSYKLFPLPFKLAREKAVQPKS